MNALQLVDASYQPAPSPRPRRRMSREAALAVGLSLAVHVGVIGYIATQKFAEFQEEHNDPGGIIVDTYVPPKETPRPHVAPPKAVPFHPVPTQFIPTEVPPIETVVTPKAPEEGPPQVLATTVQPPRPEQFAELRQTQPPAAKVIRNPSWLRRPSGAEIGRLYPRGAAEAGLSGAATLMCEVVADGSVRSCAVIDESPKGRGFGAAALAGARLFKLNPRAVDGEAVEGAKVRIPLVFSLAD